MVKEPRAGRVKTRLARDIGTVQAAWWFRHQVAGLLRRLDDPRWQIWLSVAPDRATRSPAWPPHLPRIPQGRGDLGQRMKGALDALPPGRACLIGGDIPGVSKAHIARGFAALGRCDAVFGPAEDGGFWLTGFRRTRPLPRGLFEGVRWSSEDALEDSLASLSGRSYTLSDSLCDVDCAADMVNAARGPVNGLRRRGM
ncbi:glycosyltransferase [Rhodobacteraceae bacterium 63075]|nr:glycosyltransferase [Rhodobacteraceae bacterium 63075]